MCIVQLKYIVIYEGKSLRSLIFVGECGDKKSTLHCLGISHLFLHILPKPVQVLVMYDEMFQALVVDDLLFPKPFLDLGFDGVVRWK
jgi:hypothetical protein